MHLLLLLLEKTDHTDELPKQIHHPRRAYWINTGMEGMEGAAKMCKSIRSTFPLPLAFSPGGPANNAHGQLLWTLELLCFKWDFKMNLRWLEKGSPLVESNLYLERRGQRLLRKPLFAKFGLYKLWWKRKTRAILFFQMINRKESLFLGKVSHGAWEAQIQWELWDSSPS